MKKNFFYMMLLAALPMAFVACSSDDDEETPKAPELETPAYIEQSVKLQFSETDPVVLPNGLMLDAIDLTDAGTAIFTMHAQDADVKATRANSPIAFVYYTGTFQFSSGLYLITLKKVPDELKQVALSITNTAAMKAIFKITLNNAEVINGQADVCKKIPADEATKTIVGKWNVKMTRIRHTGDVTGVKDFEGCNLNQILDYAKSKAQFDETLSANKVVTSVEFTTNRTFYIFYENGDNDFGTWDWVNEQKGSLSYQWNEEDMGNRFMDGEGVFDIRDGFYCLTLSANVDTDDGKDYDISSTWFLVQDK